MKTLTCPNCQQKITADSLVAQTIAIGNNAPIIIGENGSSPIEAAIVESPDYNEIVLEVYHCCGHKVGYGQDYLNNFIPNKDVKGDALGASIDYVLNQYSTMSYAEKADKLLTCMYGFIDELPAEELVKMLREAADDIELGG